MRNVTLDQEQTGRLQSLIKTELVTQIRTKEILRADLGQPARVDRR